MASGIAHCVCFILLAMATAALAGEEPRSKRIPDLGGPVPEKVNTIPYPNGAVHLNRGLSGAFMTGRHRNLGEDQSLYQWQGELSYFYQPWFSGGLGFKITAGEPDTAAQKIFNRYFLFGRFHKAWEKVSIYAGPQLGVGNLNILTDSPKDSLLAKPIGNTKPTISLNMGAGWKVSRWGGLTLGSNLEYSLVDEEGVGTTNALNQHISPGIAVDILSFADGLGELVSALYVNVELQFGFLIFERSGHREDQAAVIGLSLAF